MAETLVLVIHLQQKISCYQDDSKSTVIIDEMLFYADVNSETIKTHAAPKFILGTRIYRKSNKPSSPSIKELLVP